MKEEMRKIPGVDKLLYNNEIKKLIGLYGSELVTFSIRKTLDEMRTNILAGDEAIDLDEIISQIKIIIRSISDKSLIEVINGTGIVLHTNLGRALLGDHVLEELKPIVSNYSNLEFDLNNGHRGQRNSHISELMKFVTQAEDAIVVNNNAAAVMLILKTFAEGKEVIISRGELIEIGGSFRIPEIMKASGCKMIEVGATNRTKFSDYENAITKNTALIFKAHKSNYFIDGFTEEVELSDLSDLAKKNGLIFVYDLGSGLLRKPEGLPLEDEPDVRSSLQAGCDIVSFSGDKLLGGPQAGIIVGRSDLIQRLAKAPMMRALRVGKMTIAALSAVMRYYMKDEDLLTKVPIFEMLNRKKSDLKNLADKLQSEFDEFGIKSEIIKSKAQCGGGTLPQLKIDSLAMKIIHNGNRNYAKKLHQKLLELDKPILGILREGDLLFDVLSIKEKEIKYIAESVNFIMN
ncbi:MAG: L-seryl-tRNA(Sec) selenium transferase [Candidatus Cloacimonetes bacterium]|jgi:L-seryl-tRNA(Ser) seleniumtransferase|nr:L-seryl-tRNA(Sec) selenium transferase [Candidatus Cloacimonadota bacterium]